MNLPITINICISNNLMIVAIIIGNMMISNKMRNWNLKKNSLMELITGIIKTFNSEKIKISHNEVLKIITFQIVNNSIFI